MFLGRGGKATRGNAFRLRTSWELAGKERESHEYQVKGQRVEAAHGAKEAQDAEQGLEDGSLGPHHVGALRCGQEFGHLLAVSKGG